ncbi:conserved hypothetical protein [Verrucomicrobia bacterium]|nr:conserved hypothetical protein [Verrucomicrobiota bacterium]
MAHTVKHKTRLIHRVRRLSGQLKAVERALEEERECSSVLLTLAACRGAMDSLMAEIIEGHIRFHILDPKQGSAEQRKAAQEVISVVRRYLK